MNALPTTAPQGPYRSPPPPPPPVPWWRTWAGVIAANWRTSLPALLTLAGLEVAVSHAIDLPVGLTHACEVAVSLGTALGLLSAADAQRLAALEAAVLPPRAPAKRDPEALGALPEPYEGP